MTKGKNGNGRLEASLVALNQSTAALNQSVATLNQAMATFLARVSETDAQLAETNRRMDEMNRINSERFARIEALLLEHSRTLRALPDAVREKIGFKLPEQRAGES